MDQVRPQPIRWPCDHANVDWSTYPLQTPSGGGRAPTPYRSKTPANGMTQKGIDLSRPVTEGWVEPTGRAIARPMINSAIPIKRLQCCDGFRCAQLILQSAGQAQAAIFSSTYPYVGRCGPPRGDTSKSCCR